MATPAGCFFSPNPFKLNLVSRGGQAMANPILEHIQKALGSLVTLRITTVVGPINVTVDNNTLQTSIPSGTKTQAIQSTINLLEGDITTVLDPAYVSGDLTALRTFHENQVVKGHDIVVNNFNALVSLAKQIGDDLEA
jgi:hypothetical protein